MCRVLTVCLMQPRAMRKESLDKVSPTSAAALQRGKLSLKEDKDQLKGPMFRYWHHLFNYFAIVFIL